LTGQGKLKYRAWSRGRSCEEIFLTLPRARLLIHGKGAACMCEIDSQANSAIPASTAARTILFAIINPPFI
jgi:hypothetical protein